VTYVQYTDPERARPGRQYGAVVMNRAESLLLVLARNPALTASQLASLAAMRRDYTDKTLKALVARGLARSQWASVQRGDGPCDVRVWYAVGLVNDLLEGRDHPGTLLGRIRAAVADGPQTEAALRARLDLPAAMLHTVLRLMVLHGDLRRSRHMQGERFALPVDSWDDEEAGAA
jgi:hypothetical protein